MSSKSTTLRTSPSSASTTASTRHWLLLPADVSSSRPFSLRRGRYPLCVVRGEAEVQGVDAVAPQAAPRGARLPPPPVLGHCRRQVHCRGLLHRSTCARLWSGLLSSPGLWAAMTGSAPEERDVVGEKQFFYSLLPDSSTTTGSNYCPLLLLSPQCILFLPIEIPYYPLLTSHCGRPNF